MMVDFLTVEMPDPFGVEITGGEVVKVAECGEVEWSTLCRKSFKGSWSSQLSIRNILDCDMLDDPASQASLPGMVSGGLVEGRKRRRGLELSGNPAKFVQGHNLFGSDDPAHVLGLAVRKVAGALWHGPRVAENFALRPEAIEQGRITRIDLTGTWLMDRPSDVLPFLRAMEERVWCPYRGRGVQSQPGTLYYGFAAKGKRAKDWQLKIYAKGIEVVAHPLPMPALEVPGLLDEVNRMVRVELTLRTRELKKLGLDRIGNWSPEKVGEVWRSYVDKLDFGEAQMNLDATDLAELGLKPRLLDVIASWKAGNDMRAGRSKTAFYRIRQEVRDATGYDIATPVPKSNVVPLRRVIEARPALKPLWADQLSAALERAA